VTALFIGDYKFKGTDVIAMARITDARLMGRPFPPGQPGGKVRGLGTGRGAAAGRC
jgi:hypothetical protein